MLLIKKSLTSFFLFIGLALTANAQTSSDGLSTESRIEIDVKDNYENEDVYPLGSKGLVITGKNKHSAEKKYEYKYDFYDNNFKLQNTESENVSKKQKLKAQIKSNFGIHSLFFGKKEAFTIVSYNRETNKTSKCEGNFPKKFNAFGFKSNNKNLVVLGEIKRAMYLLTIDWNTGEYKQTPVEVQDVKAKDLIIINFEIIEGTDETAITCSQRISRKIYETKILIYSAEGEMKQTVNVSEGHQFNFVTISVAKTDENNYSLTGTYSIYPISIATGYYVQDELKADNGISKNEARNGVLFNLSIGIYFGKISNGRLKDFSTHPYTSLDNFFKYLSDKNQDKIERRKLKAEEKGKEYEFKALMTSHPLIKFGEDYFYLGESYYPTYITSTNSKGERNSTFNGYQYTHAVLICFDKNGNKKWDQVFELNQWENPFYVKKYVKYIKNGNSNTIDLVYSNYYKIVSKSFDANGNVVREISGKSIETLNEAEKISNATSNMSYWYENYFIVYGYQKIKNTEDKSKRKVLFFNKIKF